MQKSRRPFVSRLLLVFLVGSLCLATLPQGSQSAKKTEPNIEVRFNSFSTAPRIAKPFQQINSSAVPSTDDPKAIALLNYLRDGVSAVRSTKAGPKATPTSGIRGVARSALPGNQLSMNALRRKGPAERGEHKGSKETAYKNGMEVDQAVELPRLTAQQHMALDKLRDRVKGAVEIRLRPGAGTPTWIKGKQLERGSKGMPAGKERDVATARSFLRSNRDLLRLDDPDVELLLARTEMDALGIRHLKFKQTFRDLPVWPAELKVHLDKNGNVYLVNGAYASTPSHVPAHPSFNEKKAVARAREAVLRGHKASISGPELIIYARGNGETRLAWRIEVIQGITSKWLVVVDATTGAVLTAYNKVKDANVLGSGVDLFGNTRPLNVWEENGLFFMVDTTKLMFDPTSNPPKFQDTLGGIIILDAENGEPESLESLNMSEVMSSNATQDWLPDGVSAAWSLSETYDYFSERHSRNSYDDEGTSLIGIVRYGTGYDNAFWSSGVMVYGDAEPFAGSLDIVGHEVTHGVVETTANLQYLDQSGALNESFSDIFAESIEARSLGATDWLVGSQLPNPARNMMDPSSFTFGIGCPYPSKMSEFYDRADNCLQALVDLDNGGVHVNSSIVNHAFYLLV